jgi:hypothetical protein
MNNRKQVMKTIENKFERATTLFPSKVAALAAAAAVIAALPLTIGAFSGQAAASSGSSVSAVGGFQAGDLSHVAFAAQMNGTSVTGHVVQDVTNGSRSGPVTCLNVNGNRARILWMVTHSDFPGEVGQTRQFDVTDNGEPTGGVPKDFYTDLQQCDSNGSCSCTAGTANGVLFHGNIIVSGP